MLIAVDRNLEYLKQFLELNGYEAAYINDIQYENCDVYIYDNNFTQNVNKIATGDKGTLLIKSTDDFNSILLTLKTKLITPIF